MDDVSYNEPRETVETKTKDAIFKRIAEARQVAIKAVNDVFDELEMEVETECDGDSEAPIDSGEPDEGW